MAFPRAPLKRFNEIHDKTPGVGSYNLYKENAGKDKAGSLARVNETLKNCRDKALMAAEKGTLPKHIEEIHAKLAKAEERVVDLEILKISWDKQRELTEKEKGELKQKLIKYETVQEKFDRAEGEKVELEKQIKSVLKEMEKLEQQTHELQLRVKEVEEMKYNLEKEKSQLTSELERAKKMYSESEDIAGKQKDEMVRLKQDASDAHNELESLKEKCEKDLSSCAEEKRRLENEIIVLSKKLAQAEEEIENLSQHLVDVQNKLLHSMNEIESLKQEKERDSCLQEEMQDLISQIESLNVKCDDSEMKFKTASEKYALEIEALQEASAEKTLKLTTKLEQASEDVEELTQHVVFTQGKLQAITKEAETLKEKQLKESEEFEGEKQFLTSQIQSLILRCEECEEQLKKTTESHAMDLELCKNQNSEKVSELMEKNRNLEEKVSQVEKDRKEVWSQEQQLKDRLSALEETQRQQESESATLVQELTREVLSHEENNKALEVQNDDLVHKLEHALERVETIEAESEEALRNAKASYSTELNERLLAVENAQRQQESESAILVQELTGQILSHEEKNKALEVRNDDLVQKLEHALERVETIEAESKEALRNAKASFSTELDERLLALENVQRQQESESAILVQELTGKLLSYEEKKKALEVQNDDLVHKLEHALERVETIEAESEEALRNAKASYSTELNERLLAVENVQRQQDSESAILVQELTGQILSHEEKNKALEVQNDDLVQKLEHALERVETIEAESKEALRNAKASFSTELSERLLAVENAQRQQESESATLVQELTGKLHSREEKNKTLEAQNNDLVQKLEHALERVETTEAENAEALRNAKASYSKELAKLESYSHDLLLRQSALEDEKNKLESELHQAKDQILLLEKETNHLQSKREEIASANENLTQYLAEMEKEMERHREESDTEIEGLNTIIAEMSEKIEQFECERAELLKDLDEDWKEKYDALVKKMEPFKEVLDGFELERQLLQDRDKFTNEQLEKLTQECIKNMGHQNHKQRIKYLDKIKQENLNLFKTVQELQEHNRRQDATIKKLKEKTADKTETSKKPWHRTPLKEGNRL